MNNNPTAFPYMEISEDGVTLESHAGMTLRDWFAGRAMQSALDSMPPRSFESPAEMAALVAEAAYLIADAMLAARKDA